MATYEELTKMLDDYNPQQQELGVNFNAPDQEETPYQKMIRETYGSPAQMQQEEPGLLGSIVNRVSGQPQQQGAEEPSYLNSFLRGAVQQGAGTLGGQVDLVAGATGSETARDIGDSIQKAVQNYGRPKEYTFDEITKNGLSSIKDYLLDPNGFTYDVGGGLGSSGVMMAEAALLSAAIPSSIAAAGTGAIAAFASKIGLKSVASALKGGSTAGKLIKNVIASSPLEAGSESGGVYREMTTDKNGNRIDMNDVDMDKVQEAMAKNFVANLGILGASNLLESVGIGRLFGDKMRQGILGKVRDVGEFMATNVAQNAWEEGAQTGASQYAQGQIDNISQIVNPMEWNTEQIDAATTGAAAGVGMGALYGGAGYVRNKIVGPQQQEGENPAVNIQNAVTNNEFADAVAIAKHDTSTNLVDRMRNLEGRIGHHASDGTNCARTIGLALAGTDYQDLINVDDFVKVAQQKGQLQDPANYVPKPGDLAVVNNGNHIVMVSENGGTIQNGSSHDGVYESSQSPLQMFGAVKYYISTSGMSSGEYGVAGNLQGVNEDQRKEDYYQNLVAQESQRRADAIREVLGAKTHEQEQQEQAVSEAQKYQQDNASELGPINDYYNAFTRQELDALSPEEKQTLKNNFDSFYADKQNWGHTAIEKVQTARGMYNQLLANRQQTAPATAPATNVQQQVTQAQAPLVQSQTASTPTTTHTENKQQTSGKLVFTEAEQNEYKQRLAEINQGREDLVASFRQNGPFVGATSRGPVKINSIAEIDKLIQDQKRQAAEEIFAKREQQATSETETHTTVSTTEKQNPVVQQQQAQQNQDVAKNATTTTPATEQQQQVQQPVAQENNDEATPLTGYQPTEAQLNQARQDIAKQREEQLASDVRLDRDLLNTAKAARRGVKSAVAKMQKLPENVRKLAESEIETPREKLIDMINDDLATKKRGLKKEQHAPLVAQANQAFQKGFQLLNEGKTAEEAFEAVKNDIVKPTKEGKKNGKSEKSEKLSHPETSENRNQNGNAESEKVEQQKGQTGESGQNQNQAEVTKKTPAKRHIDGFKNEVDAAVKSMTFTQEKADELVQKYNNSLNSLLRRGEITQAEADANRYAMEDSVKRGLILNDGRKLLSPKVRKWLDENPFVYDKSKSREENAAVAQALKEKFIKDTGISRTIDEKLTPERKKLQARIVEYLYNIGIQNRKRERKATLAIGYPAAGKSTVTKDLTDNKGYLLIDADEAKKLLPEFHGGALADIVHDESSALSKSMFMYAIEQGDNICYPTIGGNYDSIQKKISQLHNDKGVKDSNKNVIQPYEVTLSLVDVSADEALRRISKRFEETGRFDNPKNISKLVLQKPNGYVTIQLPNGARKDRLGPTETIPVDNEILKNYLRIKDERGVERYEWIDNSFPVDADYSEILRESGELSNGYDGRLESGSGESNRGSNRGSKGRKRSVTEKQQQANRADTEDQSGSSIFKATEVKENADNQGTVSEASGAEQSGNLPENGRGREAESVSGYENGTGETVLRANDEDVRNKESDRGENAASGLSEQSADVGRAADGQDAVRRGLSASEQTYNGELEKTNKAVEDGTVSVAEAKKQAEAAADKFDKELDKAEAKAEAPTTGQGDPIIVSESLRKTYEGLKGIVVKVGNKSYRLTIVKSNANNDGIMRWQTTDGKAVEGADNPLRCLLYEAIKMNDNGEFLSIDEIIKNLENKKEQVGLTPNFQDALDLARKLKKGNVGISTTNTVQKKTQNATVEYEATTAQKAYERKVEDINADREFQIITDEEAARRLKEAKEKLDEQLSKIFKNRKGSKETSKQTGESYEEMRERWVARDKKKKENLRITIGDKTYTPILSDGDKLDYTSIEGWTDPDTGEKVKGTMGTLLQWMYHELRTIALHDAKLTPGNVLMENGVDAVVKRTERVNQGLVAEGRRPLKLRSINELIDQLKANGQEATIHFAEDIADTTPDNTTKYSASVEEASNTENGQELKRSLDELIAEAKKAFKGAKGFRINRNDLIFTMPNGLEMKVNIKDQILLNAEEEAKARKEHGLTDTDTPITVEGYARRLDKGSLVALSKESGRGTTFHEAFHTIWDWVLTDKEKEAMLKHFTPIAEAKGIDVEEAMADGYRDWLLARLQHKGTLFGKLFQKIKDFANAALRVLTGAENVHNIYQQIEEGKVWNRDAKGRFATEENAVNNDKKFLVTNKKITGNTRIPVIDVTNVARANTTDPAVRAAIADSLIGKTFRILGSDGIGFTQKYDEEVLPNGRIKRSKPNDHLVRGAGANEFDKGLVREERQKALAIVDEILNNAMYIEKHPDAVHGTDTRYVDLYTAVQNGDKIYPIHIQAKEKDGSAGEFVVGKAMYYQLTRKGSLPATAKQLLASANDNDPSITVAQLLQNVKDKSGRPYVTNGKLNFEPAALSDNTKYAIKYANPKDKTDYKNNPLAAEVSTRQTKAKGSTEDSETQRLIADLEAVKKDPALFKKLVDALKSLPGLSTSERNTEKAADIIINRIKDNIVYLYDKVPENIRERARKWYDGGNRVAKEWKKRYGISEHASAGIIAVLSPQKDWFTNMTLAERILDCVFGHANEAWTEEMSKQADGYSEMVEQPVKESKKDKAAREKRGEPVKTEIVKVTHKSIVEGDENREALERARNKTLKQLLNAGDYEAAAIWIKCFDKAHNDRGYRVLTPEGGTGDYVKTSKGENAGAAWGDFGSIAKAISIAANPTWENISYQLGEQHKVRNFSNNIRFPESKLNATIDTHAVGVGLMQPTSGGSASVEDNFGAAGGSDIIGISGTYPLYFEAYRRAAAEISEREGRQLSAREMQSITWEAIRNLFPADMKTTEKEQSRIAGMIDEAKARLKRNKNKEAAAKKVTAEKETGEKLVNAALEKVEDGKNISDILSGLKEQATAKKLPRLVSLVEDAEKTVENHNKDKKKSKKPLDKKKLVNGIKNKWNGQENFIQDVIEAEERIKAGADEEVAYRDITYKGKDQVRISNLFKEADKQIKNLKDPAKAKEILDKAREMVYNIATKGTGQLNEFSWESTPDDVPLTGTYDRSNVKITPFDNGAGGKDKFVVGFSIDPSKYLRKENAEILRSMIDSDKEEDRTKAKSALTNALEFATDWILAEFDIRDNVKPDLSFQSKDGKLTVGYTVEISNPQQTVAVAKMFGRLFEPESVIATGTKEVLGTTGKTMSIEIPAGWGSKEISELSNKLGKITDHNGNPVVATHSTSDGQMTIVNTSKWSDDAVLEDVKNAVPELNVNGTDEFATILDKNSYEDKSKEGGQHKREDYIGRAIAQRLAVELNPAEGQALSGNGKPVEKGNRSGDQKGNRSQNESVRRKNKETEQPAKTGVGKTKYSVRAQVNFEVAPDPDNTVFKKAWDKQSRERKQKINDKLGPKYARKVLALHKIDEGALKNQIGGFEGDTNPSFYLDVDKNDAIAVSKRLGYVMWQNSMMVVSSTPIEGGEKHGKILITLPKGWGEKEVAELYDKLYTIKDDDGNLVVGGHSTRNGKMEIVNLSDMDDQELMNEIKKLVPDFKTDMSEAYVAFPYKDNYGFAETKEGAKDGRIYDESTNLLRQQFAKELADELGIAEEAGLSGTETRVEQRDRSGSERTAASEAEGLPSEGQGRDESSGRIEAREAARLYDEAAEKYPQIKDKAVSKNVKYAIRQSLDFGKVEGDILDSASGNHTKESRQEPSATANTVLHPLGEQVGGMPLYTEKGFSLTRKLIDEGYADLTGQTVNSISDLAEIAQVLRHPGYEKLHYVYVKDGKVIYHETVTAAFPATVKAQYKGESERKYEKRMRETMRRIGADTFYMLHNHPDGVITPSEADFDLTDSLKSYTEPSGVKFGGHIILDTTECNVLTGGKNESRLSIPEHAQIHYDEKADVPNILLGTKLGPTQALVDVSKKLADQSKTTVFFTDTSDKVRSIIQLPEEFMQMDEGQKMRYLRWAAKHEYGTWAYIVTSDKEAYKSLLPLYRQGSGVYDILLTSNPETAKGQGQYRYSGSFGFYDFFGQESALASAHKVLGEGVNKEQVQGTQGDEGASSMPDAKYSIISAAGKVIDKADAYVNRNVRTPNENTATGRASKAFSNTQNKNKAQTWTEWLKDRFDKFYREWIDKNDAIHNIDDTIEKITGKKLAEEDKIYNMVQGARAYAQGAADTLVQGTKEAFDSLKDALGRGIDPKDTAAMDRLKELKKDFKFATVKEALEPIMKKDMDRKYPDYLEKHGINNWHDAFSNYLGARRILELVRLVEDKSLQYITHDKKEFTDFIDRHPEYEKFRPKPFAKGSWRDQVQNIAKTDPALAEKMAKDLAKEYKFPKGVTRADLEALVREAPKEFDTSAQIYYQLQRNLLTMMELGHLIPADIHDKVNKMYKEYCPLMIDYSDTAGLDTAIAQFGRGADSIANVDSMLKHVLQLGSERGLISPLESTYKSIQALTNRAERNKVAVHFVKTVANSPELQKEGLLKPVPGSSPDAKNCIFTVLINGKKVAFQTTQDLYGPVVGYDMPAAGIVEGLCRSAAQTLRYGATTSPSFIIRNFIRDTIFAGVSSRNGFVPVLDSFRGMWAYLHDKELRGEFDAMGITAYNYFGSGESAVKSMEELMGEKDWQYLKSHPTELIKELIKYIPKKFAAASEVVEASTRMGEYMRARAKGKSMQEAALDARDVTLDFSRSGFYGQRVNMMVPFFNACIQGGDKMFNRMIFSKDPKVRMQTARMLGLYILLPSVALWFMHKDEPWYEELDPHIKMNNWIIGKFRIPKPQEAGIAFGSGIEAMLDKLYDKDPKAGKEWVNAMREVLVPNLIPTVGLPILEWITNYSLFRDKAIEGNRLKRLPAEMRYNNNTTELSKALGKISGLSPVKLDNTIRGYTGTLGMMVAQIPDIYFEDERNLPSKPVTERVMVRDFFLNDMNMNRTSEEFYEMVNTAQQQHAGYGKKGHPTPAVKAVNKALRDVSKQQKEIQEITNAKNISPDRKRQMIDKKREIIKMIEKKTLQRYGSKFGV